MPMEVESFNLEDLSTVPSYDNLRPYIGCQKNMFAYDKSANEFYF